MRIVEIVCTDWDYPVCSWKWYCRNEFVCSLEPSDENDTVHITEDAIIASLRVILDTGNESDKEFICGVNWMFSSFGVFWDIWTFDVRVWLVFTMVPCSKLFVNFLVHWPIRNMILHLLYHKVLIRTISKLSMNF